MPTSGVLSVGYKAHVCTHVSWVVGVYLFFCSLCICLVVIAYPSSLLSWSARRYGSIL